MIKTVQKGDKFIWNDAIKVEVTRTYKSNKFCQVKCSSLLTSWPKKQPLPLPESFVPVDSFDGFDNDEEYWGEPHLEVSQFSDIKVAEEFFLNAFGGTVTSQDDLDELTAKWEHLCGTEAFYEEDEDVETIRQKFEESPDGAVTAGPSASDRSETTEHLHEPGIRREEDSGLASNVEDAERDN